MCWFVAQELLEYVSLFSCPGFLLRLMSSTPQPGADLDAANELWKALGEVLAALSKAASGDAAASITDLQWAVPSLEDGTKPVIDKVGCAVRPACLQHAITVHLLCCAPPRGVLMAVPCALRR